MISCCYQTLDILRDIDYSPRKPLKDAIMHLCRILNISCHEKIFVRIRTEIFKWDSIQSPLNKSRPRPVRAEREYFVILIQRLCKVTSRMNLWIVAITGRQNQNFEYVFKWVQMRYSSSEHVSCASSIPRLPVPSQRNPVNVTEDCWWFIFKHNLLHFPQAKSK